MFSAWTDRVLVPVLKATFSMAIGIQDGGFMKPVVTLKLATVPPRFRLVTDVVNGVVAGTTRTFTRFPVATVVGVVVDAALQLTPPSVET